MNKREQYEKENGLDVYASMENYGSFKDEYVKWLELELDNNDVLGDVILEHKTRHEAVKEPLDLFIIMLSEIRQQAETKSDNLDDGITSDSAMESIGYITGVDFVIDEIKKRTHSA